MSIARKTSIWSQFYTIILFLGILLRQIGIMISIPFKFWCIFCTTLGKVTFNLTSEEERFFQVGEIMSNAGLETVSYLPFQSQSLHSVLNNQQKHFHDFWVSFKAGLKVWSDINKLTYRYRRKNMFCSS